VARVDDLLAEIGYGKIPPRAVVQKLFPQEEPSAEKAGSSRTDALKKAVRKILPIGGTGILVRGENDLLATLAKCCRPVPGEEIVGYVTRGRGVSVHSAACPNVRNLLFDPSREIEVDWHVGKGVSFTVDFEVQVEDRPGILARITQVISDAGSNIESIEARTSPGKTAVIEGSVTTPDRRHLDRLFLAIQSVSGVASVRRKFNVSRLGPR